MFAFTCKKGIKGLLNNVAIYSVIDIFCLRAQVNLPGRLKLFLICLKITTKVIITQ